MFERDGLGWRNSERQRASAPGARVEDIEEVFRKERDWQSHPFDDFLQCSVPWSFALSPGRSWNDNEYSSLPRIPLLSWRYTRSWQSLASPTQIHILKYPQPGQVKVLPGFSVFHPWLEHWKEGRGRRELRAWVVAGPAPSSCSW